ncbi:hypothetical protein NMY22_g351 [Coprinellus aureogranulatus]|nr:hypothetical protein NMY22_g351 [Coprinellus aureogranulatus]
MPRLAPRLVKIILKEADEPRFLAFSKPFKRRKSLHDPLQLLEAPAVHFKNHERSILLSDSVPNPITNSRAYELHKSLPPVVFLPKGAKSKEGEADKPREMTEQERKWWSSPYCGFSMFVTRHRCSDIFKCACWRLHFGDALLLTSTCLQVMSEPPQNSLTLNPFPDLLIRFSYVRVPSSHAPRSVPSLAIIPDGLEHSKYTSRKGGHSFYSLCLREAVDEFFKRQPYKRVTRESPIIPNNNIAFQIAHLLRLRVLQELEQLGERMRHQLRRPIRNGDPHTIIRRLTRDELSSIESTGTIPFENAVAVLVVPPVEVDSGTNQRPQPSMFPLPQPGEPSSTSMGGAQQPVSVLMLASSGSQRCSSRPLDGLLPSNVVPVYHGLTAFPHASQRAALHDLLDRVITLEGRRGRLCKSAQPAHLPSSQSSDPEPSDAYLLCSDQENIPRGDAAAVATALWRLRMFEGEGMGASYSWSMGTDRDIQKLL